MRSTHRNRAVTPIYLPAESRNVNLGWREPRYSIVFVILGRYAYCQILCNLAAIPCPSMGKLCSLLGSEWITSACTFRRFSLLKTAKFQWWPRFWCHVEALLTLNSGVGVQPKVQCSETPTLTAGFRVGGAAYVTSMNWPYKLYGLYSPSVELPALTSLSRNSGQILVTLTWFVLLRILWDVL